MACNCSSTAVLQASLGDAPEWVRGFVSLMGGQTNLVALLVGTLASFGAVSALVVLPYLFRICRGQDIVSECLIGKSVVTLSVDATGNGLHAAKKLVVDMNHRRVQVQDTGDSDSPPHSQGGEGLGLAAASETGAAKPASAS